MFFYLKTGGGHLAPAKALEEYINYRNVRGLEIVLADGFDETGLLPRKIIEEGYRKTVGNAVWVFELLYALNKIPVIAKITAAEVSLFMKKGIEKQILSGRPDKIVLFHFFLIKPVYEVLKKYKLEMPVLTVVTDPFSAPPLWFLHKEQRFVVFSESLRDRCIKMGIEEERIKVFPFVLKRQFDLSSGSPEIGKIRCNLGFKSDSRVILIMGGGDGMPRGIKLSKRIITGINDAEIAIVCGNSKKMYSHLARIKEKHCLSNLKIYGYIDFVDSLLKIADVVITKCGASTIMEILHTGKVPLINNYIWEQEKGNMEFVCKGRMGILEKRTKRVPGVINNLFSDSDLFNSLITNIRKASINNGVEAVSEYILNFNI